MAIVSNSVALKSAVVPAMLLDFLILIIIPNPAGLSLTWGMWEGIPMTRSVAAQAAAALEATKAMQVPAATIAVLAVYGAAAAATKLAAQAAATAAATPEAQAAAAAAGAPSAQAAAAQQLRQQCRLQSRGNSANSAGGNDAAAAQALPAARSQQQCLQCRNR